MKGVINAINAIDFSVSCIFLSTVSISTSTYSYTPNLLFPKPLPGSLSKIDINSQIIHYHGFRFSEPYRVCNISVCFVVVCSVAVMCSVMRLDGDGDK